MPLESATFIGDLNVANPVSTDVVAQGDDHFRLVKAALKTTIPNADKAFYLPDSANKASVYTVLSTDINKIFTVDGTAGAFNLTLPTLGASDDGWGIWVIKTDASANAVTVVGTINGATNLLLSAQYQATRFFWTGTVWLSAGVPTLPLPLTSLNINTATALTDPALLDELPIYDASATANRKIVPADLLKILNLLTAETTVADDDVFLMYDTSASNVRKVTAANVAAAITSVSTRQVFTSGSSTYTTPAGAAQLKIRMIGGGGSGGGQLDDGVDGTASVFNSIAANPGIGGLSGSSVGGGAGGTGGAGSASFRIAGGSGSAPSNTQNSVLGGAGGNGAFGGGAGGKLGNNDAADAATNSGGGGAGAGQSTGTPGSGGGAGEYVEIIINSPAASYSYTVGTGGVATSDPGNDGGNGGSGIIIVDEYY